MASERERRPDNGQKHRLFSPRLGSAARQMTGNPLVLPENGWFSTSATRKLASGLAFPVPPVGRPETRHQMEEMAYELVVPEKIPNRLMVVLDRSRVTALLAKDPANTIFCGATAGGASRRIDRVNRSLGASRFSVGDASRLHGDTV